MSGIKLVPTPLSLQAAVGLIPRSAQSCLTFCTKRSTFKGGHSSIKELDKYYKYEQYRVILLTMSNIEFMIISEINQGAINGEGVMETNMAGIILLGLKIALILFETATIIMMMIWLIEDWKNRPK